MPRARNASDKQIFNCSFTLPIDVYQKARILSINSMLNMREIYQKAVIEFLEKEENQKIILGLNQQTATR
ncbi:MAG: hypothetical protein QG610_639 [Euryarchaeota archaeon]|nr:hypothetical protein [Euryarchaeota archaeon]